MLCHTMNEAGKYQGAQHSKEQHIGDPLFEHTTF
jgi:hypothetical protein